MLAQYTEERRQRCTQRVHGIRRQRRSTHAHCADRMRPYLTAFEFRNKSWLDDKHRRSVLGFEREHGLVHVIMDAPEGVSGRAQTVWEVTTRSRKVSIPQGALGTPEVRRGRGLGPNEIRQHPHTGNVAGFRMQHEPIRARQAHFIRQYAHERRLHARHEAWAARRGPRRPLPPSSG